MCCINTEFNCQNQSENLVTLAIGMIFSVDTSFKFKHTLKPLQISTEIKQVCLSLFHDGNI